MTAEILRPLVPTSRTLQKLSSTALSLPNQAALYESVVLLEARASSELERIVTTDEKLFGSSSSADAPDPMTKEVRRYAEAIAHGLHTDRPLCTTVMEEICSIIKGKEMSVRRVPGTQLKREETGEVIYTPPVGEKLLRDLLDNLWQWMNADDGIDPVVKAIVAHYQFEAIHPFSDGNGRTGRVMFVLYLVEQKILRDPVLFLSGEILRHRAEYYERLEQATRTGDLVPFVLWFMDTVHLAAGQSTIRALIVKEAMHDVKTLIRDKIDAKIYSQDLVNVLFRGPFVTADQLVSSGVVGSLSTAHNYLAKLAEGRVVERHPNRINRKVAYVNVHLLEALSGEIDIT